MDIMTHTLLAGMAMGATYLWGRYLAKHEILENVIEHMLNNLEKEGFIRMAEDKDGNKELIPISEIVKKCENNA